MAKKSDDLQFLTNVVSGTEEVTRTIKTPYGDFTVKLMTPREKILIKRQISAALGGANASLYALTNDDIEYTRMVYTLDIVIKESPDFWQSAQECLDDKLLITLYTSYVEMEVAFREKVERLHPRRNLSKDANRSSSDDLLSGITDGSEVAES
jgi:hypothetical protein